MFRMKTKMASKPKVKVPAAIKYHYEHPAPLDAPQFYRSNTIIRPVFNSRERDSEQDSIGNQKSIFQCSILLANFYLLANE